MTCRGFSLTWSFCVLFSVLLDLNKTASLPGYRRNCIQRVSTWYLIIIILIIYSPIWAGPIFLNWNRNKTVRDFKELHHIFYWNICVSSVFLPPSCKQWIKTPCFVEYFIELNKWLSHFAHQLQPQSADCYQYQFDSSSEVNWGTKGKLT